MKSFKYILIFSNFRLIIVLNLFLISGQMIIGQVPSKFPEHPPRPASIEVSILQNLNFGTFYHYGTGGTVTISPTGSRTTGGDVVEFAGSVSPGLFTITGNKGTVVSFLIPEAFITFGANSLRLNDFVTDPVIVILPNTANPATMDVTLGATLYVGESANPEGNYSGTFNITIVQE